MANMLDFLANQDQAAPPVTPQVTAPVPTSPVAPEAPKESFGQTIGNVWDKIKEVDRRGGEILNQYIPSVKTMLTPSIKPMQSGPITLANNPFTQNPDKAPPSSQISNVLGLNLKTRTNPFASSADAAIATARAAATEFAKNAPRRTAPETGFDVPYKQLEAQNFETNNKIAAIEDASQKLLDTADQVTKNYEDNYNKSIGNFVNKVSETDKKLREYTAEKIDTTIDPNRLWNNKSTGDKIMIWTGLVFSAMTNTAMDRAVKSITKSVDDDIASQKFDIENKIKRRTERGLEIKDEYSRLKDMLGTSLAAYEAQRANRLNLVATQLDQQKSKISNAASIKNADAAIAQLKMEALKAQQTALNSSIEHNDKLSQVNLEAQQKNAEFQLAKAKLQSDAQVNGSVIGTAIPQLTIEENIRMGAVPKPQINEAIKEAGIAKATDMMIASTDTYFDRVLADMNDVGFGGGRILQAIPFTKSGTYLDLGSTLIWQPASQLAQGVLQQHEFNALVKPFLPSPWNTELQLNTKRAGLKNAIATYMASKMPTLATYGIDVSKQYPSINQAIISPKGKL